MAAKVPAHWLTGCHFTPPMDGPNGGASFPPGWRPRIEPEKKIHPGIAAALAAGRTQMALDKAMAKMKKGGALSSRKAATPFNR